MAVSEVFQLLVYIAALGSLAATLQYIRLMFKGRVRPNRVTWLMWAVAPLIATSAELVGNVGLAALPVFMSGFCPLLVFIASFATKKAYWKSAKLDYAFGVLSVLALVLWWLTKAPEIAIIFAIASDGLAAMPTVKKAWVHPESESFEPYAMLVVSAATSFGVITTWTFSAFAFPAYLICLNALILYGIFRRKAA